MSICRLSSLERRRLLQKEAVETMPSKTSALNLDSELRSQKSIFKNARLTSQSTPGWKAPPGCLDTSHSVGANVFLTSPTSPPINDPLFTKRTKPPEVTANQALTLG